MLRKYGERIGLPPDPHVLDPVAAFLLLERELPADVPRPLDRALVEEVTPLIQERIHTLADVTALVDFFWRHAAGQRGR